MHFDSRKVEGMKKNWQTDFRSWIAWETIYLNQYLRIKKPT